jgi:plasmid stabilization system protein ParE
MKIRILPQARQDLEIGADYYELKDKGLGADFLAAILGDIDRLKIHGGVHRFVHGFQWSVSKRFPFAIYYLVENQQVDIYAVLDCRQDPKKTIERLDAS